MYLKSRSSEILMRHDVLNAARLQMSWCTGVHYTPSLLPSISHLPVLTRLPSCIFLQPRVSVGFLLAGKGWTLTPERLALKLIYPSQRLISMARAPPSHNILEAHAALAGTATSQQVSVYRCTCYEVKIKPWCGMVFTMQTCHEVARPIGKQLRQYVDARARFANNNNLPNSDRCDLLQVFVLATRHACVGVCRWP